MKTFLSLILTLIVLQYFSQDTLTGLQLLSVKEDSSFVIKFNTVNFSGIYKETSIIDPNDSEVQIVSTPTFNELPDTIKLYEPDIRYLDSSEYAITYWDIRNGTYTGNYQTYRFSRLVNESIVNGNNRTIITYNQEGKIISQYDCYMDICTFLIKRDSQGKVVHKAKYYKVDSPQYENGLRKKREKRLYTTIISDSIYSWHFDRTIGKKVIRKTFSVLEDGTKGKILRKVIYRDDEILKNIEYNSDGKVLSKEKNN